VTVGEGATVQERIVGRDAELNAIRRFLTPAAAGVLAPAVCGAKIVGGDGDGS
jgi:hypothetical protein